MRITGYLSAQNYPKFKQKAEELNMTEYALASKALEIISVAPSTELIKEQVQTIFDKYPFLKEFLLEEVRRPNH